MGDITNKMVVVEAIVSAPIENVWKYWTEPEHIMKWNNASNDWYTPNAENDLIIGGKFLYRMEAKDGSFGFDFWGIYDDVKPYHTISYTLGDGRKVNISFKINENITKVTESFETENENPIELQKDGWQAILDNFKRYVEKMN
jgi:uncharacterized protein YndB with AHSA1/START domain